MRKGRRKLLASLGVFLLGTVVWGAPPDPPVVGDGSLVRLTVEVGWGVPPGSVVPESEGCPLDLEVSGGRVVDAIAWPAVTRGGPEARAQGGWRLGTGRAGRVRARVEAPAGADLLFRASGQVIRVPIPLVLEGPQHTPPQTPVEIQVERLPWDAITARLADGDGMVGPGDKVPVVVGFNILTPEPADLALHCVAELRPAGGGEPVWRDEIREAVVSSNRPDPPSRVWEVPAPLAEGSYVLELRSSWEPAAVREGSRLSRLIRRRKAPAAVGSALRRVGFAVVGPKPLDDAPVAGGRSESIVDTVDLARTRGHRLVASGRSPRSDLGRAAWAVPEAALVEPIWRDRLRGRITRAGSEAANLAPADVSGLAWSAVALKVAHPDRPHRLTVTVTGGHPLALGVALIDPGGPGARPRVALDACASAPPILDDGPPASFSWLVWPGAAEPVLVFVNRGTAAPVRLGTALLAELPDVPAGPPIIVPERDPRTLALALSGPGALDRFGGTDAVARVRHFVRYLEHCGASAVVLFEELADRTRREALDGQAGEDPTGPDRLGLLLRVLGRQGLAAWLEMRFEGALPGLPSPDSAEALARGLVRVDARGQADGPAYHPLHPDVRAALARRVAEAAAHRKGRAGVAGLLIRLGPGPTLLGGPDTGLDDLTFARFVRETFDAETAQGVPGLGSDDPERFAARARFLAGSGRAPWLTWRSRGLAALYGELAAAARQAAGVALAVATPGLDDGPAGREARRVDLAGLDSSHAWRAVGLDLEAWPAGDDAPIVLRGVGLSNDDLAHDLATSPELDAKVAARPRRGLLLGVDDESPAEVDPEARPDAPGARPDLPGGKFDLANLRFDGPGRRPAAGPGLVLSAAVPADGPEGDEPLGHALAALDARWVVLSTAAVAGHEERVRRFAQVFRALPATTAEAPPADRPRFGVAVRTLRAGSKTYLALANDTPYPIRLETVLSGAGAAAFDDLGRGLRLAPRTAGGESHLVLDLVPFGAAAIRVASEQAALGAVTPYPSEAVVAGMQAQYSEMSGRLARLSQRPAGGPAVPTNAGFEPASARAVNLKIPSGTAAPPGWQLVGGMGAAAELDLAEFHTGQASLRLRAPEPPAAVLSERFTPNAQADLTIRAWFRSDKPDAKLRLWVEGQSAGQPFVRRSDLTAQPDWAAQTVRASALPPGGLDAARIRVELLTPGTLWVDDLTVSGAALSDPERLNASRALMAAMKAYQEKRYADFARLAGSHWARHPGVASDPAAARPPEPAGMIRTREASALPRDRRLR
jgi:hypothetical protein